MVSYVGPPDAIVSGSFVPGTGGDPGSIDVDTFPVQAFIDSLGDYPDAQVIVTLPGTADDYADGVPADTPFTYTIDLDGDGTPEYELRPAAGNEAEIRVDNQVSGNVGFFTGSWSIYPVDGDEPVAGPLTGPFYITTDPDGFPDDGSNMPITPVEPPVLDVDDVPIICFTRGTLIDTPDGARPIEELAVGDLVLTKDHGPQPIRWISSRKITKAYLGQRENLRPIRIPAGALGDGCPKHDLLVSPQHRLALSSPEMREMFGENEVLVPAKFLVGTKDISVDPASAAEYFHFMLDRHELVWANGVLAETMLAGAMALRALGAGQLRELASIFPEISLPGFIPEPARRILRGREGRRAAQSLRLVDKQNQGVDLAI